MAGRGGCHRGRRRGALALVLVSVVAVAGCSGEDPVEGPTAGEGYNPSSPPTAGESVPSATPSVVSPSSSAPVSSVTPSGSSVMSSGSSGESGPGASESGSSGKFTVTATETPAPPADAAQIVGVVRAYLAAYNRAGRNPALVKELDQYTLPSCKSCVSLRQNVTDWGRRKEKVVGDTVSLGRHKALEDGGPTRAVVFAHVPQRASRVTNTAGKQTEVLRADAAIYRAFELQRAGGAWRISAIKVLRGDF